MMIDYSLTKKRKKIKQKKETVDSWHACISQLDGVSTVDRSRRLLQLNIHPVGDSQRCAAHCVA